MREAERTQGWQEARQSSAEIVTQVNRSDWMGDDRSDGDEKLRRAQPDDDRSPQFSIGDTVRVESLGLTGEIVEIDRDNRAVILAGTMRFQARPHMMTLVKPGTATTQLGSSEPSTSRSPRVSSVADAAGDLDVRGSRVHVVESMIPAVHRPCLYAGID